MLKQIGRDNIKKINPDLTHPDFNGKYLLLRAELAMETLYLIASCETGEFYHEKLSGDLATFSLSGPGVDLKDGKNSTHYEWDGKSWLKGDTEAADAMPAPGTPNSATEVPANGTSAQNVPNTGNAANASATSATKASPTPAGSMKAAYQLLFVKFPAKETTSSCANLDYSSNFRAQKDQSAIQKHNSDLTHPNFAGSKLLFTTESIFETVTLIADCKTGKISDDFLKDHVTYQLDSRLAIVNSSDTHPDLMVWSDTQWVQISDPTLSKKGKITNTLYGDKAKLIVNAVTNPKRLDVLRFENLKNDDNLKPLFQDLNVDVIASGTCRLPRDQSPVCDIETE